ncbi:MAG: choline kinase [Cyclobacteriaceae bacterium]|jgi:choline kinase
MICIILAAGKNVRLDNGIPKSLSIVNGQTLLERHISIFSKYGVDQFSVVVGYRGEMITSILPQLSEKYKVDISSIENPSFELPNAHSLYAAKNWVLNSGQEEFLFVMADHYFEESFVGKYISTVDLEEKDILNLAVDQPGTHNKYIDLEDVTKVYASDGRIEKIGKGLTEYNYFDTGLFYVRNNVFEILENNFKGKKESISDMVQEIVNIKGSAITDISGFYWNDIDTPTDLTNTKTSLHGVKNTAKVTAQ